MCKIVTQPENIIEYIFNRELSPQLEALKSQGIHV